MLRTDELVDQRSVLTGSQSLAHKEMVTTIGDVIGTPLRYQEIPPEATRCLRAECRSWCRVQPI